MIKIKCWLWPNLERGPTDGVTYKKPEWGDGIRAGY